MLATSAVFHVRDIAKAMKGLLCDLCRNMCKFFVCCVELSDASPSGCNHRSDRGSGMSAGSRCITQLYRQKGSQQPTSGSHQRLRGVSACSTDTWSLSCRPQRHELWRSALLCNCLLITFTAWNQLKYILRTFFRQYGAPHQWNYGASLFLVLISWLCETVWIWVYRIKVVIV